LRLIVHVSAGEKVRVRFNDAGKLARANAIPLSLFGR